MPMNRRQTGVFVGVVLMFVLLMAGCMAVYFSGSGVFACSLDAVPSACKSGITMSGSEGGSEGGIEGSGIDAQSDFLAAVTAYILFLGTSGAWAMVCPQISITVKEATSLWPLSLSSLAPTSNVGVPSCGPCLAGGRRVCTPGTKQFTSGILQYGYVTGIQTVFGFAKNAQAVLATVNGATQLVITADIFNAPLWLNDTEVWWAVPIGTLACDQSLTDGTWINQWSRFSGKAAIVTFVCGRVQLTIPVTSSLPAADGSTLLCSTVLDFSNSALTFADVTVTVGQIRVAGWLVPAAVLAAVRAEIAQAVLEQGICNIPVNSLSSFKKVTLPILCPLCPAPPAPPAPPPAPPVPPQSTPISSVMLNAVLGGVLQVVVNAAISLLWPSGGIKLPLDPKNKSPGAAQLVLPSQPELNNLQFVPNGNFVVVPAASSSSAASSGCFLQLQFVASMVVEGMELDLVVPQRIDSMTAVMDFTMQVPVSGTSTKDKGGAITLHLGNKTADSGATLTCTGIDLVDVAASSAGGKLLGTLLSSLVAASETCLVQAVNVGAGLLLVGLGLPDVNVNMYADIDCS